MKSKRSKHNALKIVGFSFICILVFVIVLALFLNARVNNEAPFYEQCVRHGPKGIHIHPQLNIIINGEVQEIPADIGIKSSLCMRPLHTHDDSGIIHIESKEVRDFTVDDFFTIWNKTFTERCIFEFCTDNGTLKMYVNGEENIQFKNYVMQDKDDIRIEYESFGGVND